MTVKDIIITGFLLGLGWRLAVSFIDMIDALIKGALAERRAAAKRNNVRSTKSLGGSK